MSRSIWDGANGDWDHAPDWSKGVPGPTTLAVFKAPGTYDIHIGSAAEAQDAQAGSVDFDAAGATLSVNENPSTLELTGVFDLKAGNLVLNDGIVSGGTLKLDGGTFTSNDGSFDDVHVVGPLDLPDPFEALVINNGFGITTLAGAKGMVTLSGGGSELFFNGTQTLDNATIFLDGSGTMLNGQNLTLGPNSTVMTTATAPVSSINQGPGTITNDGMIIASVTANLNIGGQQFINNGVIEADAAVNIAASQFSNGAGGVISVGNGGTVTFAAGWSNSGTINLAAGSQLTVQGRYLLTSLGTINNSGAIILEGTIDNVGSTLTLGTGILATNVTIEGGAIQGGTIVAGADGAQMRGEELEGVTYVGNLAIGGAGMLVYDGLTVLQADGTSPGTITLDSPASALTFLGTQTLDNATISVSGVGDAGAFLRVGRVGRYDVPVITFGARLTLISDGAGDHVALSPWETKTSEIINNGAFDAAASGGSFIVTVGTFLNNGLIAVENGDTFSCSGALGGSGEIAVATGAVAELGSVTAGQTVSFADATGLLKLSGPATFAATISGAAVGDSIDLVKTAATAASVNANDQLVITDNGAAVATLQLVGDYSSIVFDVASDGARGSLITLANAASRHGFAQAIAGLGVDAVAGATSAFDYRSQSHADPVGLSAICVIRAAFS